ncbi:MAG: glutamate racemase [Candidatus Falkowbacteria bacterium]|nr:glutamate racemase [Candidatus Falkowbacteria bacterium]
MLGQENKKNIIGVFDSGLGGLTVLKYFLHDNPGYNYIYLGDNARLPYGEKSPETIYDYTREAADFLFTAGCNLIIIACNTVSAQALRRLQQEYLPSAYPDRRILGVIRPLVEAIARDKKIKSVGIIGTKATINSDAYKLELKKLKPELRIEQQATPLLVPLIEEGWARKPETKMILKKYLRPLKAKQIDALILGCTHYPFLYKEINKIMGRRILVPQPGEIIARSLVDYLARHEELGLTTPANPTCKFYTTDDQRLFKDWGEKFLGSEIKNLERVKISEL